jgi:hypothetical protein
MSIRLVSCLIRVNEELLDCDFSCPAASIEESVIAWEGCTVARWNDPDQSQANDSLVLSIADALWGDGADTEWNSDTINAIADAIRNVRPELIPAPYGLKPVAP